jgi:hypothetical protein
MGFDQTKPNSSMIYWTFTFRTSQTFKNKPIRGCRDAYRNLPNEPNSASTSLWLVGSNLAARPTGRGIADSARAAAPSAWNAAKRSQTPQCSIGVYFSTPLNHRNKAIKQTHWMDGRGALDPSRSAQDDRSDAPRGRLPNEPNSHPGPSSYAAFHNQHPAYTLNSILI